MNESTLSANPGAMSEIFRRASFDRLRPSESGDRGPGKTLCPLSSQTIRSICADYLSSTWIASGVSRVSAPHLPPWLGPGFHQKFEAPPLAWVPADFQAPLRLTVKKKKKVQGKFSVRGNHRRISSEIARCGTCFPPCPDTRTPISRIPIIRRICLALFHLPPEDGILIGHSDNVPPFPSRCFQVLNSPDKRSRAPRAEKTLDCMEWCVNELIYIHVADLNST